MHAHLKEQTTLKGLEPPSCTPPNPPKALKFAHALVQKEKGYYACLACSCQAVDMEALEAFECAPSDAFKKSSMLQRLQEEHLKLEKLRKLRLLEIELFQLNALREQQAIRTSSFAPKKTAPQCIVLS